MVPGATPEAIQKKTKSEQDQAHHERGNRQQVHGGQLVPHVRVPGEKPEYEDDE
jgi:hypothetical protein